ncbi:YeiH family protein [Otariodibacter sp.]|uniref:YeiH family protein n=1 Tax=Otariodibacter sp. TaxID=3030919 RepID=UPI00260FDBF8|nr:YeiH family protein [Otariodibacter sp.]
MLTKNTILGLIIVGLITTISFVASNSSLAINLHLSALTIAILFGMLLGNTVYPKIESQTIQGINLSKTFLLRAGIVLYGFRITLQDISSVGINAILTDAIMLTATFFITCWVGIRWLKIDKQIVQLTAAGCSICGAAAIMATSPVLKSESHKVSVAIALIVIFGTISMFLYPIMYPFLNHYLSDHQFGIYIGSSVHEVAQVYAAGSNINSTVADTSVITKMIRVMMLAPFLILLSYSLQKTQNQESHQTQKINIPWFAVWFIVVAIFNSFSLLPQMIVEFLVNVDTIFLMMAMAGLGLTTRFNAIKQAGFKPFLLGGIICIWLVVGGFFINLSLENIIS